MNYETFKLLCDGCDPEYKVTLSIRELKAVIEEAEEFKGKEEITTKKEIQNIGLKILKHERLYYKHYNQVCQNRRKYLMDHLSENEINEMKNNSLCNFIFSNADISSKSYYIIRNYERLRGGFELLYKPSKKEENYDKKWNAILEEENLRLIEAGRSVWNVVINDPLYIWPENFKLHGLGKGAIEELSMMRFTESYDEGVVIRLKDLPRE